MVYVLGDSMIKHVDGRNVFASVNIKVSSHPDATMEDLIDHMKPI